MGIFGALKKIALGSFTCIFALVGNWTVASSSNELASSVGCCALPFWLKWGAFGTAGACVGVITGAITGQTTETGFLRGAGIGAVSGAILSVELFESLINGDTLSKIALFGSLVNGKIFLEWVSPAMLKAYQWQISMLDSNHRDESDIFDVSSNRGATLEFVKKLHHFRITRSNTCAYSRRGADCCAVCLQDFMEGENARTLPICRHIFHMECIDRWLLRHGSCPICRQDF